MSKDLEKLIFLHEQKMHFKGRNPNCVNEDEEERNENFRNSFPLQKHVSPVLPDPTSSANDDYSVAVTEDGIWFKCQYCGTFLEGQNKLEFHESKCQCRPVKDKEEECKEEKMKAQDLENKALFTEHGIWYKCQHCGAFLKGKTKLLNHQSKCQPPPSSQENDLIEAPDDNIEPMPRKSPDKETVRAKDPSDLSSSSSSLLPPPAPPKENVPERSISRRTSSVQNHQSKSNGLSSNPSPTFKEPEQTSEEFRIPDDNNEPRKNPDKETVGTNDPSDLSTSSLSLLPPLPPPPPKKNVLKRSISRRTSSMQDNQSKSKENSSQENNDDDTFVDLSIRNDDEEPGEMVKAQKKPLSHQSQSNPSPENGDLFEIPDKPLASRKSLDEEVVVMTTTKGPSDLSSSSLLPPPPNKKVPKRRSSRRTLRGITTTVPNRLSQSNGHTSHEDDEQFDEFIICDDDKLGETGGLGEETMLRNDPVSNSPSKSGPKEKDEVSCIQPCQSPKREVIVDEDNLSVCESEFTSSKRLEETRVLQIKYNQIEDGEINLTFGDFRTRDTDTADKSGEASGVATTTKTMKTKRMDLLSLSSSSERKRKPLKRRSGRHRARAFRAQMQAQVQQSNPSITSKEPKQTSGDLRICDESVEEPRMSENHGPLDSTIKSLSTGKAPKRHKGKLMQPNRSPKPALVKGGCNPLQTVLSKEIRIHISPVDTSLLKMKPSSSDSNTNNEMIKNPLVSLQKIAQEKEDDHGHGPQDSSSSLKSSSSSKSIPKRHLRLSSKTDPRSADINLQKYVQEKEDVPLPQDSSLKSSSSSSKDSIPKHYLRRSSKTDPRSAVNSQKNEQEKEDVPQDSSLKSSSSSSESIPNRHLRRSSITDPKSAGISLQTNAQEKNDVPEHSSLNSSTSSNSIPKRHLRRSSKTDSRGAGINLRKDVQEKEDVPLPQDSSLKSSSSSSESVLKRHLRRSSRTDPNPRSAVEPEMTKPSFDLPEAKIVLKRMKVPKSKSTPIKIPSAEKKALFAYSRKATKPKEFSLKNLNHRKKKSTNSKCTKNFCCQYLDCGKRFINRAALELHTRTHTGERPFKCKYKKCKKSFSQITNLRNHERTHTGEKPYMCHWCKKCFSQIANLKHHERLHTGTMPYKCEVCGKKFAQQSSWGFHMKANHKELQTNGEVVKVK